MLIIDKVQLDKYFWCRYDKKKLQNDSDDTIGLFYLFRLSESSLSPPPLTHLRNTSTTFMKCYESF